MRIATVATIILAVLAPPTTYGGPELEPVTGVHYATYDLTTGKVTPTPWQERLGESVWAATENTQYYYGSMAKPWLVLDWGDITGGQLIGGFAFCYATTIQAPETVTAQLRFYADDNGFNSSGRVLMSMFSIPELPGVGAAFNTWTITVDADLADAGFTISGNDLDGDQLADFAYTFWFPGAEGTATGPVITDESNQPTAPGICDAIDTYELSDEDPNDLTYAGTWWMSSPYAQFYLILYDSIEPNEPCPSAGASEHFCTADIDGSRDCIVSLSDLSRLLTTYGKCPGDDGYDGAANLFANHPPDACVDLADLAELLTQFGDDCN